MPQLFCQLAVTPATLMLRLKQSTETLKRTRMKAGAAIH